MEELTNLDELTRFREAVAKDGLGESGSTVLIQRTLRSGQVLGYRENVVIVGDVNPGAQVVSDGNIIVAGRMRGIAHAGASGDESSIVVAFRLEPVQLRIARYISRSPDIASKPTRPEKAYVRDGRIVIKSFGK
jgi:septum site-determining protein MinC